VPELITLDPANLRETSTAASPEALWAAGAYVAGELTGLVSTSGGVSVDSVEAKLFVHVKWRRQGIGRLLLSAAMQWALSRRARELRLVCGRTDWPMRHFAEKAGARLDLVFGQIVADIPVGQGSCDRRLTLPPGLINPPAPTPLGASEANMEPRS